MSQSMVICHRPHRWFHYHIYLASNWTHNSGMSSLHNRQDRDSLPVPDARSGNKSFASRASILDRHTLPYPPLVASPPISFNGRGTQELNDMAVQDVRRTMYKESSKSLPSSVLGQKPSSAIASTRAGVPRSALNEKRDCCKLQWYPLPGGLGAPEAKSAL